MTTDVGTDARPLVSIVTPAFNAVRYMEENIASVRGQLYRPIEHIVVDGGSTDGTVDILKDSGKVRWVSEPDRGQSDALNKGFAAVQGEIIGWLNADDTYEPDAVEVGVHYLLAHPEVDLVYGDVNIIDEDGARLGVSRSQSFNLRDLLLVNTIRQPSVFFRRGWIEGLKGVRESLHYVMDWELWLRSALKGCRAEYLPGGARANFRLCQGTKSYEMAGGFRREWVQVLENLLEPQVPSAIGVRFLRQCIRKHKAQLKLDDMVGAISRKNRGRMIVSLLQAFTVSPALIGNRGTWYFLGMGIAGRTLDPMRRYVKKPGSSG